MKTFMKIAVLFFIADLAFVGGLTASGIYVSKTTAYPGDTAVIVAISLKNLKTYSGMELSVQYNAGMLSLLRIETAPRLAGSSARRGTARSW